MAWWWQNIVLNTQYFVLPHLDTPKCRGVARLGLAHADLSAPETWLKKNAKLSRNLSQVSFDNPGVGV